MMHPATVSLACLLSMLPGPPGIEFENSYLQMLPVDKSKCPYVRPSRDIVFRLYTDYNPSVYEELQVGDDQALAASHIDFKRHTVVYFHAFLESPDSESGTLIREGYTYRGDTNIIMVDAQRLEAGPWYFTAAENTWYIGQYTARLLDYLVSRGLELSDTHLVGHSLGAQAAGVAGGALASGRVARITGLDPALPLFTKLSLEHRLDASDARFVDIIHTDAGIFGIHNPMGHADFYPNGGISPQPGCELEVLWPRHMILEKCPTTSRYIPMTGLFLFTLEETPDLVKNKENEKILKNINISNRKQKKYFRYSKQDANTKKRYKKLSVVQDINEFVEKHIIYKKQIKNPQDLLEKIIMTTEKANPQITSDDVKVTVTEKDAVKKLADTQEEIPDLEISYQSPNPAILSLDHHKLTLQKEKLDKYYKQTQPKPSETAHKRQKRTLFNRQNESSSDNMLLNILQFLIRNRKNVIPVVSVMREITTLVKSANGELNHSSKERNSYIGTPPPSIAPVTFNLALGKDPPMRAFVKRILGIGSPTEQLSIAGVPGK